jgi:multiple sugar transport system permease protein
MSAADFVSGAVLHRRSRLRHIAVEGGSVALAAVLLVWSLLPIYNMVLIALDPAEGNVEFNGDLLPWTPSLNSFVRVVSGADGVFEEFWQEFGNSLYMGVATMALTVAIGSLTAFAIGRLRLRRGWLLSNAALLTYLIPASFLAIGFHRTMQLYGLEDNLWAVIAAQVAFATPYAILVLQQSAKLLPLELDEAARVDGASALQVYWRIYLPLLAPALAAVGTFALLLAWNEYLYQYLLLSSSSENTTLAIGLAEYLDSDEEPWNDLMAAAILYALPPIVIFYGLRRYMAAGLTLGALKG